MNRVQIVFLALVAAVCLRPQPVEGCLAGSGTFAQHFEAADYIVSVIVDEAVSGQIETLTIEELLKGEAAPDLTIEFLPAADCEASSYARGESWVLFLSRAPGVEGEIYRIGAGNFRMPPVEARAGDWARARVEAMRTARRERHSLLDVRWSVRRTTEPPRCVLEKQLHGEQATGEITFVATSDRMSFHVDYRLREPMDAAGSPDQELTLDIGGVPHPVAPDGAWGGTPGAFVALGSRARFLQDSLVRVGAGQVRAHLAGDFATAVGMEGFAPGLEWFRRCSRDRSIRSTHSERSRRESAAGGSTH